MLHRHSTRGGSEVWIQKMTLMAAIGHSMTAGATAEQAAFPVAFFSMAGAMPHPDNRRRDHHARCMNCRDGDPPMGSHHAARGDHEQAKYGYDKKSRLEVLMALFHDSPPVQRHCFNSQ